MSSLTTPTPGNLTFSVMFRTRTDLDTAFGMLQGQYGEFDGRAPEYGFSEISSYYDPEMGAGIRKTIFSVGTMIQRDALADAKLHAVKVEKQLTENNARRVNIDPGMVTLENFLLTTGKNFSHRIYLRDGVFAEVTLFLGKDRAKSLPWTYADYLRSDVQSFIIDTRSRYHKKLRERSLL